MVGTHRLRLYAVLLIVLCFHFCYAGCTSLDSPLCTRNGSVDPCLQQATRKAQSECVQHAVEAYYGSDFTESCPNFALVVSSGKCTGCPWHRINVTALLSSRGQKLPLPPTFFDIPSSSCSIASHVSKFKNWRGHELRAYTLPVVAGLMLLLLTGLGHQFAGRELISRPVWILGCEVPEWVYLSLLWLLFFAFSVTLSFSEDYFLFCEPSSSFLIQRQLRSVAHAATLAYSFSRCLRLPSHRRSLRPESSSAGTLLTTNSTSLHTGSFVAIEPSTSCREENGTALVSSWYSCQVTRTGKYKLSFAISMFFALGCRLILLGVFIYDHRPISHGYVCRVHYMNYRYALHVVTAPVLEQLAVAVYAIGPQPTQTCFVFRFVFLTFFLISTIVRSCIPIHLSHGLHHFFPGLGMFELDYGFVSAVHTIIVCLLGLLEPVRLGWPPRKVPKRTQ